MFIGIITKYCVRINKKKNRFNIIQYVGESMKVERRPFVTWVYTWILRANDARGLLSIDDRSSRR